jgi:hypothetical protein
MLEETNGIPVHDLIQSMLLTVAVNSLLSTLYSTALSCNNKSHPAFDNLSYYPASYVGIFLGSYLAFTLFAPLLTPKYKPLPNNPVES